MFKLLKKVLCIFIIIVFVMLSSINLDISFASEEKVYKLMPKYLVTNFNFEMMSSVITYDQNTFSSVGCFRTTGDLCGVSWETEDIYSHEDLKYPTKPNFSDVQLSYNYKILGYTQLMNSSTSAPTLTVETNDGSQYFVCLWNYVVNRPMDIWESEVSAQKNQDIRFPAGRCYGAATGSNGFIEIDFNNLYSGWAPYKWIKNTQKDENGIEHTSGMWVDDPDWKKVPVENIKKIMWTFVPETYNGKRDGLGDSYEYKVDFYNWKVEGNTFLMDEIVSKPIGKLRICDDYDDVYNLTPERIVSEYNKLGYGEIVNFYIGASHYYDKKQIDQKTVMISEYPFNNAFENWYRDYIGRLKKEDMDLIHSISMESVDAPESWWQRAWDGTPAITLWSPTPHLLSFTNSDVKNFYISYVENLARLSSEKGLNPIIQYGEPWWWYIEGNPKQPPCFYDQATKDLFKAEKGYSMHEFKSGRDSLDGYEDLLYWLRDKNGEFALILRNAVKEKYKNAQFTVLFFPPYVIDKQRVPLMMSIVNFPKEQWKYPNLDFFMLEDYDYLIADKMSKHDEVLTFVQKNLGYNANSIHYLAGFVNDKKDAYIWDNVEQGINDGFNHGFKEVYVWAYAQVKRDAWRQPSIIYASKPSGSYCTAQEISLSASDNGDIIYTMDGSEPSETNAIKYSGPIKISKNTTLKVALLEDGVIKNKVEFRYSMPLSDPINTKVISEQSERNSSARVRLSIPKRVINEFYNKVINSEEYKQRVNSQEY